jgi:hypothetical protein
MKNVTHALLLLLIVYSAGAQSVSTESPTIILMPFKDLVPPEIILKEPVQFVARGFKPVTPPPNLSTHSGSIVVKGIARDSSGIATVSVDGKEAVLTKQPDGIGFSSIVPLVLGENRIDVIATDRARQEKKITITIHREVGLVVGKYFALLIAVEKYDDPELESLTNPIHDAESLKTVLTIEYEFDPENVRILKNPDNRAIIAALTEYRKKLTRDDNLLIFYAGHGYWDAGLKQGYWLAANARKNDPTDWLSNSTIRDYIRGIRTQHTLLIADACFSGTIFVERGGMRPDVAVEKTYELASRRAITSGVNTVPDESVFLTYLMKRLRDSKETYLTAEQLYVSLKHPVISNSPVNQVPRYGTIDGAGDEGGDFVFCRR